MRFLKGCASWIILVVAGALIALQVVPARIALPEHLLGHTAFYEEEFLTEERRASLVELMKRLGTYPTNTADTKFYNARREHVGELTPLGADGSCSHPYLMPNKNRTGCVFPGRIDIGRHFLTHGGVDGRKEVYDRAVSRLLSFGRYMFDSKHPEIETLFSSRKFTDAARSVCPADKQYLDTFQSNFIISLPSQTVALHVDGVYFWGASRFGFPQWLLAAMKFSGLFEDRFVDQIQVVTYLHNWTDAREGSFVYYQNNKRFEKQPPLPRAASVVDGSKTVHAATVYVGKAGRKTHLQLDRSKPNVLRYVGDERWEVSDGERVLATVPHDDLRVSLVYRARCFKDAEEAERFRAQLEEDDLSLEDIFAVFRRDLRERGLTPASEPFAFALQVLDTYIRYPLPKPSVLVPWNYCMAGRLFPALEGVLRSVC